MTPEDLKNRIDFSFTKLFRRVKEGDMYKSSIISLAKAPYEITDGGEVTVYTNLLYVNLWLMEFTYKFYTQK